MRFDILYKDEIERHLIDGLSLSNKIKEEMIQYCENDTTSLYKLIHRFEESLQSKGLSLKIANTISMLSYNGFLLLQGDKLLDKNNNLMTLDSRQNDIVSKSYIGGITDVFKQITISAKCLSKLEISKLSKIIPSQCFTNDYIGHFDIVSSYPSAMTKELGVGNPVRAEFEFKEGKINNKYQKYQNYIIEKDNNGKTKPGFYTIECIVNNPGLVYQRHNNKLASKTGKQIITLSTYEIDYYLETNNIKIIRVLDGFYYAKSANIFKE